jgi:NOL1/NOP2/sun family putative RNA methylase
LRSFRRLYERLPQEFIEAISPQYEPKVLERIFAGFMVNRPVTLRVNKVKTDVRQVMERLWRDNIKYQRVLWYEDALVITNRREKDLEAHELYQEGHVYLQSLSSMIPPLVLAVGEGQTVLDLTAAPGGKSTQLAAIMGDQGFLLANELNPIRAERLKFNVERQGAQIIEVRVGDGKRLEGKWGAFFDAVLLDAPCSGVGLFLMDNSQTYRGWSVKRLGSYAKEQKKLMEAAFKALKPGGVLVYSTCTLMREENEDVVEWALERFRGELSLEPFGLELTGMEILRPCLGPGRNRYAAIKVIPSENYEGFFVAKLRKKL